jgi:hypothetical protein
VQGIPRRRLARLYTTGTGSPLENWRCDTQETVNDLLETGSWIYVAGAFGSTPSSGGLGGSTVNFLGRVNPGSGVVDTSWRPQPDWLVNSLATSGSQLYAGGSFNRMSGLTRRALARITLPGGTADSGWNPDVGNLVTAVAVSNGAVFISGNFERVGNFVRKGFAKFNPNEAQPDSAWNPAVEGIAYHLLPDGAGGVKTIASRDRLLPSYPGYIGGKTGYTNLAKETYVGMAQRDGHRMIVVAMYGADELWDQSRALLDWGFSQYGR